MKLWLVPLAVGVVAFAMSWSAGAGATDRDVEQAAGPDADPSLGAELFRTQCSSCHGVDGDGVDGRGPDLFDEGRAAADFVLRTGRMPMADPEAQARRGPVRYTEAEIRALVDYVGTIGTGPDVPDVNPARGDVAAGGDVYRLNCAACHVASGAGAAIGGGRDAPSLMSSTPTQIGEAVLVGPGAMPVFDTLTPGDLDDLAAYIDTLQRENDDGVSSFGGAGPVAEGLAAWLLCLLPLVALTRWIGTPHEGRDEHAHPDDEPDERVPA